VTLDVFVLDEGSSDGTSEAGRRAVPRGRPAARPLRSELVEPGDAPRPCDTMNGQAALISRAVVQRIGNIDPAFVQLMGDFDYGLRARAAGCEVWVAPGTVGTCAPHPEHRTDEQPVGAELRRLWSNTELLPGPWAVYSRRWAGKLWPMYWLRPLCARRHSSGPPAHATCASRASVGPVTRMSQAQGDEFDADQPGRHGPNLTG
jgi:GT2 family glycosyltransferase